MYNLIRYRYANSMASNHMGSCFKGALRGVAHVRNCTDLPTSEALTVKIPRHDTQLDARSQCPEETLHTEVCKGARTAYFEVERKLKDVDIRKVCRGGFRRPQRGQNRHKSEQHKHCCLALQQQRTDIFTKASRMTYPVKQAQCSA